MSSSINDIETYRRKRRRKRWIKRIILFLIVMVLLSGALLAFSYFQDFDLFGIGQSGGGDGEANGFPISMAGDKVVSAGSMGKNLAVITETKMHLYSDEGKSVMTSNHGYSNPVFKAAQKKLLVYDRGGGDFKIEGTRGTILKKTLTDKIVLGEISPEGYVAIVTQSDRYASVLHVYDSSLEEIFVWYSENQIVAADFKNGSKGCVVAVIGAQGGEMVSSLVGLDFAKEKEEYSTQVKGVMALSVDIKASGQTQLIGDTMACSFSSDGKLKQTYTYNKTLSHYDNSFDKGAALILTDAGGSVTNTAVVLGSDGAEKTSKQVGSVVKGLSCDGSHLLLLSDEKVVYYDLSLANPKTKGCSSDAQSAVLIGENAYVMGSKEIQKISMGS